MYAAVQAKLKSLPSNRSILTNFALAKDKLTTFVSDKFDQLTGKTPDQLFAVRDGRLDSILGRSEVFESADTLRAELERLEISAPEISFLVGQFFGKDGFLKSYLDLATGVKEASNTLKFINKPLNILAETTDAGTLLPNNIVFGMMLGTYSWVSNAETYPYADKNSLAILLYGDPQHSLTAKDLELADKLGYFRPTVIEQLGNEVAAMLNLAPKTGDQFAYMYEGVTVALGMMALEVANNTNNGRLLEVESINIDEHYADQLDADGVDTSGRILGGYYSSIRLKPEDRAKSFAEIISKRFTAMSGTVADILGYDLDLNGVSQRPIVKVKTNIRRSPFRIPKATEALMNKLQTRSWSTTDSAKLFDELLATPEGKILLQKLEGWVDISETEQYMPADLRARIEAKNQSVIRDIDNLIKYRDAGLLGKFYIRYSSMIQGRLMQVGPINPQNSKAHRHYVAPAESRYTVNAQNMGFFKTAVVQWLEGSPDKANSVSEVFEAFDSIYANADVQAALDALDANNLPKFISIVETLTGKDGLAEGANWAIVDALYALQAYRAADNGKTPFESTLLVEADGITNGYAISLLQFSPELDDALVRHLNQTGTYTEAGQDHSLENGKPEEDIYTEIGVSIRDLFFDENFHLNNASMFDKVAEKFKLTIPKGQENFKAETRRKIQAIRRFLPELDNPRKLAKQPFMIFNYGAGLAKIVSEMRDTVRVNMQQQLVDLQVAFKQAATKEEKMEIAVEAFETIKDIHELFGVTVDEVNSGKMDFTKLSEAGQRTAKNAVYKELNKGTLAINFKLKTGKAAGRFNSVFYVPAKYSRDYGTRPGIVASAVGTAMNEVVGASSDVRNVTVGALDIVNRVFISEYTKALDNLRNELGRKPSNSEILKMVRENETLAKLYPAVSNQNTEADSMLDLGKWLTDQNDTSRKVEIRTVDGTRSHNPSTIRPAQMAMHAIVRMIQNLDSQIMNTVLDKYPNTVNIYDANIANPNAINGVMTRYGKSYLEIGLNPELGLVSQVNTLLQTAIQHIKENPDVAKDIVGYEATAEEIENGAIDVADTLQLDEVLAEIEGAMKLYTASIESVRDELRENPDLKSQQLFLPPANESAHNAHINSQPEVDAAVDKAMPRIEQVFENPRADTIRRLYVELIPGATNQDAANWWADVKSRVNSNSRNEINAAMKAALIEAIGAEVELENIRRSLGVDNQHNAEYYSRKDIAVDLQDLFNDMVNQGKGQYESTEAEQAHVAHLQEVLSRLLGPVAQMNATSIQVNSTDKFTNGSYDVENQHITVNVNTNVAFTYAEQTAAEVFVHEGLHAVAKNILASNPAIRRQLELLQRQMGRTATYEIFMAKDANGNIIAKNDMDAEIRHAKKMFDYVFGKNDNVDQIEEFFVYGLTHPGMIEFGQNTMVKTEKGEVSAIRKMFELLDRIMDVFRNIIGKAKTDRTVHEELFKIAESMVAVQTKAHTRMASVKKAESYAFSKLSKGNQYIVRKAQSILKATYKPISPRNNQFTAAMKISWNIINQHFSDVHRSNKYYEILASQANAATGGLIKEFGEGALDARGTRRLLEKKHMVEANREHTITEMHRELNQAFLSKKPLTRKNKINLTKAILKTDLSSLMGLFGMTPAKIVDLLVNTTDRAQLEAQLRQQLGVNAKSVLDNAARDLALFMTTGKSKTSMLRLNAAELARIHLKTTDADTIANLDALITLYAINNTSTDILQDAHAVAQRELAINPDRNGVAFLLASHAMYKEDTQAKLFYGNPTLMQKGYIQQIHPSLTSGQVAPMTDEAALKKQGFTLAYQLGSVPGVPNTVKYGYFVNHNSPDPGTTTGMYALEDNKSSGTKLSEILGRQPKYQTPDGLPDTKEIKKFLVQYAKEQEAAMRNNASQNVTMIPLLNDKGQVVDFRIHMDHASLENDMQQELEFDNVFSRQQAAGVAKFYGARENIKTTNFLLDYASSRRNKRNAKLWVNIFDPAVKADTFDMLPKQAQNYIKRMSSKGNNVYEFYVSKDMMTSVFGFKNMSVQNSRIADGIPGAKYLGGIAEAIWQAVVGNAVSKIVIGLPEVVYSNMHSNFFSMVWKGIPPSYLIKKLREGANEVIQFKEDSRKATKLNNIIRAYKLPDSSPEARELSNLRKSLANNRVTYMINAGMFTTIAEDYDPTIDHGYEGRAARKWRDSALAKRVPETIQNIGGWLYGSKTSAPFKVMEQAVQISDFISRYALMEYRIREQGVPTEAAFKEAMDTFVNYNQPMSKLMTYLNSIGGVMFVKFFMRANRVGYRMLRENPLHLTTAYGLGEATGIETLGIYGDTIYGGRFMPQIAPVGNITENAFDFSGANALGINPLDD